MAKIAARAKKIGWNFLGKNLGRGGQGDVELAERVTEPGGQKYAFKYLGERGGSQAYERFRQELEALRKVSHPGIVKVFDYAKQADDFQYYVMEYIEGAKSLRRRMDEENNPFFRNPLKAVEGFIQIVEALAECEKAGIVHRDISPANVLVTDDCRTKLIDFGLCHIEDGRRLTLTEEAVGTPHYRQPECSGYSSVPVTIKADLYSAGKILWSMITNKTAFDRERPAFNDQALVKMLPEDKMAWHLHHIFARTVRHDPNNRYADTNSAFVEANKVRRLIVEGFKPLEELASGVCPICGIGSLEIPTKARGEVVGVVQKFEGQLAYLHRYCWLCPYCFTATIAVNEAQIIALRERERIE